MRLRICVLAILLAAMLNAGPARAQIGRTWYGCEDLRLTDAREALGQSRTVEAGSGHTRWRTVCAPDGRVYVYRVVADGCPWLPAPGRGVALQTTRIVYTNASGEDIEVSGCARRPDGGSVPLRPTTGGCSAYHDWAAGRTTGLARVVYSTPGDGASAAPRIAQPCAPRVDIRTVWEHVARDCTPASGSFGLRWHEIMIESDPPRIIRSCQPEPGETVGIRTTADGCAGMYIHDLASGVSYPTRRWFLANDEERQTVREWITGCVQDPTTWYGHGIEFTRWQHDDATRESQMMSDTVVETPSGRVVLERDRVRLRPRSYQLLGTGRPVPGQTVRIGCEQWRADRETMVYRRPDGTELTMDRGPLPARRVAACP